MIKKKKKKSRGDFMAVKFEFIICKSEKSESSVDVFL